MFLYWTWSSCICWAALLPRRFILASSSSTTLKCNLYFGLFLGLVSCIQHFPAGLSAFELYIVSTWAVSSMLLAYFVPISSLLLNTLHVAPVSEIVSPCFLLSSLWHRFLIGMLDAALIGLRLSWVTDGSPETCWSQIWSLHELVSGVVFFPSAGRLRENGCISYNSCMSCHRPGKIPSCLCVPRHNICNWMSISSHFIWCCLLFFLLSLHFGVH